jgi:hypothetical protein
MHASSYSHYPSSASAEVTVDSGRFWQIVSCQRERQFRECLRAAEKSAALFVLGLEGFPMNGPEQLCTWYLRLNGYLTITNFYAHDRHETLGEVDVIGVRFPHSQELHFKDSEALKIPDGKIDVVLAEAKRGNIDSLNNSWNSSESLALEYFVRRVGIVSSEKVDDACTGLRGSVSRNITLSDFSLRIVYCCRSVDAALEKQGVTCVRWGQNLAPFRLRSYSSDWEPTFESHRTLEAGGTTLKSRVPSSSKSAHSPRSSTT